MTENRINFYLNRLGNEDWICSCDELDLMGEPNKGDLVYLPINAEEDEQEMYVVLQKYVAPNEISYFCKPYNWED